MDIVETLEIQKHYSTKRENSQRENITSMILFGKIVKINWDVVCLIQLIKMPYPAKIFNRYDSGDKGL